MMNSANLPSQADLNSLYGEWNPLSYRRGFQNQALADQFREQAFAGNELSNQKDAQAVDQASQMNPLLIAQQGLTNDSAVIRNQSSGLDLAGKQALHEDGVAAEREKLRAQLGDDKYIQLGHKILNDYMGAIKEGNPDKIQKLGSLLDLVGGKMGGEVSNRIQSRNFKEGDWMQKSFDRNNALKIAGEQAKARVDAVEAKPAPSEKRDELKYMEARLVAIPEAKRTPEEKALLADVTRRLNIRSSAAMAPSIPGATGGDIPNNAGDVDNKPGTPANPIVLK